MSDCVNFDNKHVSIDPYIFGLWLGDGHSADVGITSADKEIIDSIYEYAKILSLDVRRESKKRKTKHPLII